MTTRQEAWFTPAWNNLTAPDPEPEPEAAKFLVWVAGPAHFADGTPIGADACPFVKTRETCGYSPLT